MGKRRLLLINLALLAVLGLLGHRLWLARKAADARAAAMLGKRPAAAPPPPVTLEPMPTPVRAESYIDVAQGMLFSKDRNPNVVVETPPPKPMPPLPKLYGVMNLGEGPMALMSEVQGKPQKGYKAGEAIGPFKLVAILQDELVLEWDGKKMNRKFSDLVEREAAPAQPEGGVRTAGTPAPAPTPTPPARPGPSNVSMGGGYMACQPGDTSAPGAVVDGMRKVVSETPFGKICRWEPVGK